MSLRDPWARGVVLALVLVVLGIGGVGVAWAGASRTLSVPEQVAFTLSGGFGGLALAGTGLALLQVQRRRYAAAEERRELTDVATALEEIAEALAARGVAGAPSRRRRVLRAR